MTNKITKLMQNGETFYIREYTPGWWQPWDNTIAYFPFQDDKNNTISWWPSLSSSWATITTIDNIKCIYFDGTNTQYINKWFTTQDITSVMVRIKWWYSWFIIRQRSTSWWDNDRVFHIDSNNNIKYDRYENGIGHIYWPAINDTDWHCIWITEDSWWWKIFLDGNVAAVASNSNIRTFSILTWDTWIWSWINNGSQESPATWYMAQLVLMDASITVDDFLDFYNQTKSLYGIS